MGGGKAKRLVVLGMEQSLRKEVCSLTLVIESNLENVYEQEVGGFGVSWHLTILLDNRGNSHLEI